MPLAISQDNSVATVKPRGKSPYGTKAGGICPKIGTPYGSQRVCLIIVLPDMMARTHTHTEGKEEGGDRLNPCTPPPKKRLREEESPRFTHQTGLADESVTVTFTKNMQSVWPAGRLALTAETCAPSLRRGSLSENDFKWELHLSFVCLCRCVCLNHAHFQDFLHVYFKAVEYSVWIKY